ncbi:MAG: hybrid sensor histidine kinase/response regulator [Anaerolineae bacterium]|nr:hybrid sensor histidine kinase/response regulator [Anaerolineae bacterium]
MTDTKINILVIDDDPGSVSLVHHMLLTMQRPHMVVEFVDTYEKGLAALRANRHDVYLIDYRLGNESGVNLLRRVSDLGIDVPMIFLTAYGTYDIDEEAMRLGAMDYLDKKHLTPELLDRSIRYALERKRVEIELKRLNERVSTLEQLKTDMIRMAAHDIKSPMTAIQLNLYMLEKLDPNMDREKFLELTGSIGRATARIKAIVMNILSLEHIEELHMSSLHDVEFNEIVMAACREYQEHVQRKSQTLVLQIQDEPVYVYSNSTVLSQAVINLIDNAIKYTPEDGQITIRLHSQNNTVVFEVEDNGPGIPEDSHAKVFQPFFRGVSEDHGPGGTGIGLYLVKNLVVRHNGSMIFQSIPGQGSLFGFRLPLVTTVTSDAK